MFEGCEAALVQPLIDLAPAHRNLAPTTEQERPLNPVLGLEFHHLGLAVRRTEDGVTFLKALGYSIGARVVDPEQNAQLMMCTHESMPAVEIIAPTGTPGPVDRQVDRHSNGVVYHVCYTTRDLTLSLQRMTDAGLRPLCISPPKPAVLFNGLRVSFYNILGVGLIEIIEQSE